MLVTYYYLKITQNLNLEYYLLYNNAFIDQSASSLILVTSQDFYDEITKFEGIDKRGSRDRRGLVG